MDFQYIFRNLLFSYMRSIITFFKIISHLFYLFHSEHQKKTDVHKVQHGFDFVYFSRATKSSRINLNGEPFLRVSKPLHDRVKWKHSLQALSVGPSLVTDGSMSFFMANYERTDANMVVGHSILYVDGDYNPFGFQGGVTTTNCGVPGRWIFKVDGEYSTTGPAIASRIESRIDLKFCEVTCTHDGVSP
jgi:hypothetical protein